MLPTSSLNLMQRSLRCLGVGILLAALPFALSASPVTEDFTFNLAGLPGTGEVTFDPSLAASDSFGPYNDAAHGLTEFDLSYNGVSSYDLANALAAEVFLPTNHYNNTIPAGQYGVLGVWVVPGTLDVNGFESLIEVDRRGFVFLLTGVDASSVSFGGSGSSLTLQVCTSTADCPNFTATKGEVAPEPVLLPLTGAGLAGLWFARRRRKTV
jgi:hypothetical protein